MAGADGLAADARAVGLGAIRARPRPRFGRAGPQRARHDLHGLVGGVARKDGLRLAEHAGEATPYGMQCLLSGARWDADAVRDDLRDDVAGRSGNPGAVLVVDETGFLEQGERAAGVARQYSGTADLTPQVQLRNYGALSTPGCRLRGLRRHRGGDGRAPRP